MADVLVSAEIRDLVGDDPVPGHTVRWLAAADGGWQGWPPPLLLGTELAGKTLGIVGAGRIGQAVGRRARGFGMRILYNARTAKPDFEEKTQARRAPPPRLLRDSEVVTLHLASTPDTR